MMNWNCRCEVIPLETKEGPSAIGMRVKHAAAMAKLWFENERIAAKKKRVIIATSHAQTAYRKANVFYKRGETFSAKVWEHHAMVCRRVTDKILNTRVACTP